MKNVLYLFLICLTSGVLTLTGYKLFIEKAPADQEKPIALSNTYIPTNLDFTSAAESTVNAVVHVKNLSYVTTHTNALLDFFYGYKGETKAQIGTGSGVIISEDGYIVTNNHVIENASELEVTLNNDKTYKAQLIGTDKQMDIALLKIQNDSKLPYLKFADSDQIKLGEWVLAVGNPFNLTSTVTAGIISAKARNLSQTGIQSFIQTDAVVNPGNSGGALVNTHGELVGINTMISSNTGSYVGYAFAVPSNVTKKIVEDLLTYGNVQNAALGIQGFELNTSIAQQLEIKETKGFYIQSVVTNSGAEKAGLKQNDIILQINDKDINNFIDIRNVLNTKRPGDIVSITYKREDTLKTISITLIKGEENNLTIKGFTLENLTSEEQNKLSLQTGVKITAVTNKDFLQYQAELKSGILLSINNINITNIQHLKQLINQLPTNTKSKWIIRTNNGQVVQIQL
ncbi:MAG: trypsin-like peptidase domain-containing protein [Flavobacteriaceae bacterium]|jgi:Do/DeqQ family serine protease|nr:trypsin-like peptidase domain-containing protein [Flavobacteriaceae bacterium]